MKCPNCRNEIHNSSLKCPYCNYIISYSETVGYATEPVYRRENQYNGDPYYKKRDKGYNVADSRGYDYNAYNGGVDYTDNYSYYYEQKPKTDYGQVLLPISIFILGLQLVILMLQVIVLLQF